MNENHDSTTGEFTSAEPLTGRAYLEHEAGYVPMQEERKPDEDLTVKEAAEQRTADSDAEPEITVFKTDLPENVTMTIEQAVQARVDTKQADQAELDGQRAEQIRKDIDELRGVDQQAAEKPAEPPAFDPEKALEHPQIKEAIQKVTAETEAARLHHVNGLAAATQMAEATFFNQFPELAGLEGEQRVHAFAAIAQNDPQRAEQIKASVNGIANLFQQYSAENGKLTVERETKQRTYAKTESDRFEDMIKGETRETRASVQKAILDAFSEYGASADEARELLQRPELQSALAQRLLWDAGKYRMMRNATMPKAGPKPVPPVQRPGTSGAVRAENVGLKALEARLNSSGNAKDAAALLIARRASRG